MERQLLVSVPGYHKWQVKPQNFEDFCAMFSKEDHGPHGLWRIQEIDKYSGEVQVEQWIKNSLTDTFAGNLWQKSINSSVSAFTPYNVIAINNNGPVTTLAGAITSGATVTSLSVNALPGTLLSGTQIVVGAGSAQTQTFTASAQANAGATSITVTSATANANYAIGSNVSPVSAPTTDVTSLGGTSAYTSALSSGNFAFSGTGAGNRQVTVTNNPSNLFSTTGSPAAPAANYTDAYLVNTNPVASASHVAVHIYFYAPASVNSSTNLRVDITEKI
jgi:hypothetical protein